MFHMTNCGLPNVWLQSGFKTGTDKFGSFYSIDDLPGLYRAIALALAHGSGLLSADELRVIRRQLGLTQAQLGAALGRTEQTVLLWERSGKIPADSAQNIKLMVLRKFSPHMIIEEAFRHLEQRKPERIVLTRRDNQWECTLTCVDPILLATRMVEWNEEDTSYVSVAENVPSHFRSPAYPVAAGLSIEGKEEPLWTLQ